MNSTLTFSVLAFVALIGCGGCAKTAAKDSAPPPPKLSGDRIVFEPSAVQLSSLKTAPAEMGAGSFRHVTGRLVWNEDATVRMYLPVSGRVVAINAKPGDRVDVGSPLAQVDSVDFGQAQADARKATADLLLAERTLERARDLFEHDGAARKDLELAENVHASALSEQHRTAAHLALLGGAKTDTGDEVFTLRSPMVGIVVEKNLNLGQEVRADLMLANAPQLLVAQYVISDPSKLWVWLDVTEVDVAGLKPGQELQIHSRGIPGKTFLGRLEYIGQSLDPSTRTIKVRGTVDNASLALKAEMYVDIDIGIDQPDAPAADISGSAVFVRGGHSYIFTETAPGTFQRTEVENLSESMGRTLVGHGLRAGDRVVVEGALLLEELLESEGKS
jgi:cobalt-zinc-cadmium efflux system membrane fusion protein